MGAIDLFLGNSDSISKGFNEIRGVKEYLICKKDTHILCFFYAGANGEALINQYLTSNNINAETIELETKKLKNKSDELADMLHKKIVILDKKIALYEDVVKLSHSTDIKGYKEGKLKGTINVFTTL